MLADKTPVNDQAPAPDKAADASHAASNKGLEEVHQAQSTPAAQSTDKPGGDAPTAKSTDSPTPGPSATASTDKGTDPATSSDLTAVAAAVRQATGDDNYVARWADSDRIIDLLKNRTEAERKTIDDIYKQQYKTSVADDMHSFMSGTALAKFDATWNKKDNDSAGGASDRINTSLVESQQGNGRSQSIIEQDLKDSMRTLNPTQVKALEDDYQAKHGQSLKDAIAANDTLSGSTRDALNVYLNKTDKSADGDFDKLTKSALDNRDLNLLAETMSVATPEQRLRFSADGGDDKLAKSFSGSALTQARDYSKDGRLSVEQQVSSNTGYLWDNNQGIELGLARMTEGQRSDYAIGKSLSLDNKGASLSQPDKDRMAGLTDDQKASARQYFDKIHGTLTAAGNDTEVARWDSMISSHGGGLAARMDQHRGWFYNSSTETIKKSVQDMSEDDWNKAKQNPDRERADLRQALTSLGRSPDEVKSIVETFDKRIAEPQYKVDASKGADAKPDQHKENPADTIHTAIAGFGGGQTIVDAVKGVPPEKLADLRRDYATKYGTSLDNALMDKLNNQQMAEVQRHMVSGKSMDARVDQARDEAYRTRDGIGSALTDTVSATGGQADDSLRDVLAAQAQSNKSSQPVDRAKVQNVFENYAKSIDNNREAKSAAGNYAADGLIAGAAIAATVASGGTGLPLIAATLAAAGAATKVGAKSLMMGNDYDWNVSNISTDAAGGAIMGATSVFGPGQVAAVFKLGGSAAEAASSTVFTNFAEKGLLAPGAADTLRAGTASTMHEILASGSTKIEGRAFASVAEKAVSPTLTGQARIDAIKGLQDGLAAESTKQYANQTANWLANQARSQGLNTMAGTAGGATSGLVDGVAQWDSTQSLSTNFSGLALHTTMAGLSGGAGAFALGGLAKTTAFGVNSFRPTPEAPAFTPVVNERPTLQRPAVGDQPTAPVTFRRAANDNNPVIPEADVKAKTQQVAAANDNYVAVQGEQKLVANGYNGPQTTQTTMADVGSAAARPLETPQVDSTAGNVSRSSPTDAPTIANENKVGKGTLSLKPKDGGALERAPLFVVPQKPEWPAARMTDDGAREFRQYIEKQSAQRASSGKLLPPEQEAARALDLKQNMDYLQAHLDDKNFSSSAFADLMKLKFSEKPPSIDIPLDKLKTATPAAMELSAKLLKQANDLPNGDPLLHYDTRWRSNEEVLRNASKNPPGEKVADYNNGPDKGAIYKRNANEMYGDQYEVAANNFLRKYFNSGEIHEKWEVPRGDRSSTWVDPADYIYIAGGKSSPSDHAKFDGLFINLKTGEMAPVDLKSSFNAENNSSAKGAADYFKTFIGASGTKPGSGITITEKGAVTGAANPYSQSSLKHVITPDNQFVVPPTDQALATNLGQRLGNNGGIPITKDLIKAFPSLAKLGSDGETLAAIRSYADTLPAGGSPQLQAYRDSLTGNQMGIKYGMTSERNNSVFRAQQDELRVKQERQEKVDQMMSALKKHYAEAGISEDLFGAGYELRNRQNAFGVPGDLQSVNKMLDEADRDSESALILFDKRHFFDAAKVYWQGVSLGPDASKMTDLFNNAAKPEDRGAVEALIARDLQTQNAKLTSDRAAEDAAKIYKNLLKQAQNNT